MPLDPVGSEGNGQKEHVSAEKRLFYVSLDDVGAVSYGQQTAPPLPKRKDPLVDANSAGGFDRR